MAWWWWREVVDRVVMRGGWEWTLCNGFNLLGTTWTSSGENTRVLLRFQRHSSLRQLLLKLSDLLLQQRLDAKVPCPLVTLTNTTTTKLHELHCHTGIS